MKAIAKYVVNEPKAQGFEDGQRKDKESSGRVEMLENLESR